MGVFTEEQEVRLRQLMCGVVREYWAEDGVKELARTETKQMVDYLLADGMKAKIAAVVQAEPVKALEQLFRSSGMVVKTQASQEFDAIVNAMLQDEDSGLPAAVRQYTKDNFEELVARAVKEIVAAMVVEFVKGGSNGIAAATQDMMRQAFMNSSVNTRF